MSVLYHTSQEPGFQDGSQGPGPWDHLTTQEVAPPPSTGKAPYEVPNGHAVPVNQRSPLHWTGQTYNVSGKAGRATRLLTSQRGRKSVTVIVPTGAAAAVYLDSTQETLVALGVQGFPVAIGAGISIESEDEVWAVSATAGTDTQVAIIVTWG